MSKLKTLGAVALLSSCIFSTSTQAEGLLKSGPSVFNYNYADLVYLDRDRYDGLALRFSADFQQNYAFNVGFSKLSSGSRDFDSLTAGITYHIQTAAYPQADWVFDAAFQSEDDGSDDTGILLGAGLRYGLNDKVELNGSVNLTTVNDTDLAIKLRGLYEIATGFSALLETSIGDDSAIGLGLRFYWR